MALIYNADLSPSKIEILTAWLPGQPWCPGDGASAEAIGAYRFDDPAGEVGIETHLLRLRNGATVQVPLTYRSAPLIGAESALLSTMSHSVLGQRWVYDAASDPVYATALATAIITGSTQAELRIVTGDGYKVREPVTTVRGSGAPGTAIAPIESVSSVSDQTSTTIRTDALELILLRAIGADLGADGPVLTGSWPGAEGPTVLAVAREL